MTMETSAAQDPPRRRTRSSSGLRSRVLREKAVERDATVFGTTQANAYFNARRLRRANSTYTAPASTGVSKGNNGKGKRQVEGKDAEAEADSEAEPLPARSGKRRKPNRVRAADVKARAQARADADAEVDHEQDQGDPGTSSVYKFKMRPAGETVAILRRVDAEEDVWRREHSRHAWPTFNECFPEWAAQLRAGFGVLLHGMGSKLSVLQAFVDSIPVSEYVVQVHGYLPSIVMKDVVKLLHDDVFAMPPVTKMGTARSQLHMCRAIAEYARQHRRVNYPHVYIVIHSLDGPALRDPDLQSCFAQLSTTPFIHIIASIDSVNAPALWSEMDTHRFRWLHHRVDTLRPYTREADLRLSREGKAAEQSRSGVQYILQSLTPTDVGTLEIIAQQQLAMVTTGRRAARKLGDKWADYHQVYQECRKKLLHATRQSMKNSVKCLEDNGLIKQFRVKSAEKLMIPLPDDIIRTDVLQPAVPPAPTKA